MRFEDWIEENRRDGSAFERLSLRYLRTQSNVSGVWLWDDYPERTGADMGIDIVVHTRDGEKWAVQCKNYSKAVSWADIATFVGASSEGFTRRILMTTTGAITGNARKMMTEHDLEHFGPEVFTGFDCSEDAVKPQVKLALRDYQVEAVQAAEKVVQAGGRGVLILPTGAGKTLIMSRIAENRKFLFVVPNLSLAAKTAGDMLRDDPTRRIVIACSDETAGRGLGHATVPVIKDGDFSRYPTHSVITTVNSVDNVLSSGQDYEVAFLDEAHRMAKAGDMGSTFWNLTCPIISATATPRIAQGEAREYVRSMDDEKTFGPIVYERGLRPMIDEGYLSEYRVHILAVRDEDLAKKMKERSYISDGEKLYSADDMAFYAAMEKARDEYGVRKVITYHSKTSQVRRAATELRKRGFNAFGITGSDPEIDRRHRLAQLAHGAVITSARTLQEGIDVPSLDAVAFASPKHSFVDIVQSVGRALRLDPDNPDKIAHILIPVVIGEGEDAEAAVQSGAFSSVFSVLKALSEQDEALRDEVQEVRLGEGAPRGATDRTQRIYVSDLIADVTAEDFLSSVRLCAVSFSRESAEERVTRFVEEHGRLPRVKAPRDERLVNTAFNKARRAGETWAEELYLTWHTTPEKRVSEFVREFGRLPKHSASGREKRVYGSYRNALAKKDQWALELKDRFASESTESLVQRFWKSQGRIPSQTATDPNERRLYGRLINAKSAGKEWAVRIWEESRPGAEERVTAFVRSTGRLPRHRDEPNLYATLHKYRRRGEGWALALVQDMSTIELEETPSERVIRRTEERGFLPRSSKVDRELNTDGSFFYRARRNNEPWALDLATKYPTYAEWKKMNPGVDTNAETE